MLAILLIVLIVVAGTVAIIETMWPILGVIMLALLIFYVCDRYGILQPKEQKRPRRYNKSKRK